MPRTQAVSTAQVGAAPFFAGKNKIINGDFRINQRGFSSTTTYGTYGFDRWWLDASSGTTYSAQTFTAGAAPVAGYEGTNFARLVTASQSANGDYAAIDQRIEDVRTLTNQTVTVSLWAKASTGTPKIGVAIDQHFGSGGSANVTTSGGTATISTSWARYSFTFAIPSISGKTIGTGSYINLYLFSSVGSTISGSGYPAVGLQNATIDFWGVQFEAGSVATAFTTATGTLQGELAACMRYYQNTGNIAVSAYSTTGVLGYIFPVPPRTTPTVTFSYNGTNNAIYNIDTGVTSTLSSPTIILSPTAVTNMYAFSPSSWAVAKGTGFFTNWVINAEL